MRVLVRVSVAVKGHHDHGNSYKGEHLTGGLIIGQMHGGMQADMVLEKELRVLYLDPQAAEGD